VRASSGIKTIADLKGKRIVTHIKSNVSLRQLKRTILATAGMTFNDIIPVEAGGLGQNINKVVEGRADAAITALRIPVFRKAHVSIPGGAQILALGPKATDEFMSSRTPGSRTFTTKPAKGNVGVNAVTKIAAFDSYVNVGSQISNEEAYTLIKTMHPNWKELQKPLRVLRGLKPNQIAPPGNVIPYHPGAVKYYKEAGVWTAANDKRDAELMK
jgi:TRAP transporter TAXI family solute receptor